MADIKELALICGRRAGKSRFCALLACFFAIQDYSRYFQFIVGFFFVLNALKEKRLDVREYDLLDLRKGRR